MLLAYDVELTVIESALMPAFIRLDHQKMLEVTVIYI